MEAVGVARPESLQAEGLETNLVHMAVGRMEVVVVVHHKGAVPLDKDPADTLPEDRRNSADNSRAVGRFGHMPAPESGNYRGVYHLSLLGAEHFDIRN
jgi:hypothetical protein